MPSYPNFDSQWPPDHDGSYAELAPRAAALTEMVLSMLEVPDWTQTRMHYTAPLGSELALDLLAQHCTRSDPENRRNLQVRVENPEGITLCRLLLDPDDPLRGYGKYPKEADAAELLAAIDGADPVAEVLVANALRLHLHGYDKAALNDINALYASLLPEGSANDRVGIWHTFDDGTFVGLVHSTKEGEQPWPNIDFEYELAVRVKTPARVVDFQMGRDGLFETFDTDPDTGKLLRSIIGESNVLGDGDDVVDVNFGGNAAKHAVMNDAERAMGLRALNPERLDYVERWLGMVANERRA